MSEELIINEIIESFLNHPGDWRRSYNQLVRDSDGLIVDIYTTGNARIVNPINYSVINNQLREKFYEIANKLWLEFYRGERLSNKEKEDSDRRLKELSTFLNIDSRKNKLEHLREVSELKDEDELKDERIEKLEQIFPEQLKKFKKIFSRKK